MDKVPKVYVSFGSELITAMQGEKVLHIINWVSIYNLQELGLTVTHLKALQEMFAWLEEHGFSKEVPIYDPLEYIDCLALLIFLEAR